MKVVFLDDVAKVGKAGDMKEVADGYARNYLLPRKLAVLADSNASRIVEAKLKEKAKRDAQTEAEMTELAKILEAKEITLTVRAGEEGKLYGSVTSADIAEELAKAGITLDKKKIELAEPIHTLGNYEIPVRLIKDIMPKLKVTVAALEEEAK